MEKFSSENYDFHFLRDSIAENDIEEIAELQENCYKEICSYLSIEPNIRIQYYLLDTPELVGEIYGDNEPCNGFASPPDSIYAVYNEEVKCIGPHEDAHILSYTINRPKSAFIREGLAMFFDKLWWDKTNEDWVRSFLQENKYIDINQLLLDDVFFNYSDAITYPIAGAFTKFLLENYGINKYISLYRYTGDDFENKIKEVYKKEIDDLEKEFISSILSISL
ncbi:MAG TPA: hypothetical protein VIG40_06665 [Tissierellaceae bacterium]